MYIHILYDNIITSIISIHRYNKHIKGLCRNPDAPEVHLSHSVGQDVSARFLTLVERGAYNWMEDPCHICVLSAPKRHFRLTEAHLGSLRWIGCNTDCFNVNTFSVTHIMGTHFRAGEWGQKKRCGSVITTVVEGRSLYARVVTFLKVRGDKCPGYAIVRWFGVPEYPHGSPLVVRVSDDGSVLDRIHGVVIKITSIDPSQIIIDKDDTNGSYYYMMRDSGYDTTSN